MVNFAFQRSFWKLNNLVTGVVTGKVTEGSPWDDSSSTLPNILMESSCGFGYSRRVFIYLWLLHFFQFFFFFFKAENKFIKTHWNSRRAAFRLEAIHPGTKSRLSCRMALAKTSLLLTLGVHMAIFFFLPLLLRCNWHTACLSLRCTA